MHYLKGIAIVYIDPADFAIYIYLKMLFLKAAYDIF